MMKRANTNHERKFVWPVCFFALCVITLSACAKPGISITWSTDVGVGSSHLKDLSDIPDLIRLDWKINGQFHAFDVQSNDGSNMEVSSCKSLFSADRHEMMPSTHRNLVLYRSWAVSCYVLMALDNAASAKRSYVDDFVVDAEHIRNLPVGVAFAISDSDFERMHAIQSSNGTLSDYIGNSSIKMTDDGGEKLAKITDGTKTQTIQLLARADFNHDGMQDLLFSTYEGMAGGSFNTFHLYVVTRTSQDGPLELVKNIRVMGPHITYNSTRIPRQP